MPYGCGVLLKFKQLAENAIPVLLDAALRIARHMPVSSKKRAQSVKVSAYKRPSKTLVGKNMKSLADTTLYVQTQQPRICGETKGFSASTE
jgi:hypothetical protein